MFRLISVAMCFMVVVTASVGAQGKEEARLEDDVLNKAVRAAPTAVQ